MTLSNSTRFTMSEQHSRAVDEALVRLHDRGLVYRGERLVNWCPALGSAISDVEVDRRELDGPALVALPGGEEVELGVIHDFAYKLAGQILVFQTLDFQDLGKNPFSHKLKKSP